MEKTKRLLIYGLYVILCLTVETFILWLFPYTGLGGLICWPLTIIFALGLGFFIFKTTKRQLKIWQHSTLFLSVFTTQIFLQLWTTPQDFGGTTFYKIGDAFRAYKYYNKINYTDFPNLTTGERVAYIYKFKDKLPNSFVLLQIDSTGQDYESVNQRTYVIENNNGKRHYDSAKLNLIESDTATIIIEYFSDSDTLVHKMNRNFLNIKAGGWGDKGVNLNVNEDNFELETGIEKLLYGILERTRKPNR
jgi:hypothetical protein